MDIPSHELQAFRTVATVLNFSAAAIRVHITQSALSQRIQNLEKRLGLILFIRDRKAIKLTEAGTRLLRYCQAKDHLESELLNELISTNTGKLGGHLRVAGYSSIMHSVIMPVLAPLLRENPAIQFDFSLYELAELPAVLMRGEADFVVMDHQHPKNNLLTEVLGYERYVLIQSSQHQVTTRYLDHDPNDNLTNLFLKKQGNINQTVSRSFVDDINGVLKGVTLGLGQGVVPCHLLQKKFPVQRVKRIKPLVVPVVLHYYRQPWYSRLQKTIIETLKNNCKEYLTPGK